MLIRGSYVDGAKAYIRSHGEQWACDFGFPLMRSWMYSAWDRSYVDIFIKCWIHRMMHWCQIFLDAPDGDDDPYGGAAIPYTKPSYWIDSENRPGLPAACFRVLDQIMQIKPYAITKKRRPKSAPKLAAKKRKVA